MKKSEIFHAILDKVSEIAEVRVSSIIDSSKYTAAVDARMLVVQYSHRMGLSYDDIALYVLRYLANDETLCPDYGALKRKAKTVHSLFSNYSDRCIQSKAFCLMSKDINAFCEEKFAYQEAN